MTERSEMLALAAVLRSRGRNNSLHDIERAASLLERLSARTDADAGYGAGFEAEQLWSALKDQCAASPDKSVVKKLVLVSEEDVRATIATLPAPAGNASALYLDRTEVRALLIQRGDADALRAIDQLPILTGEDITRKSEERV